MPIDPRMRAQIELILDNLEGAAAFPGRREWDDADDVDYLYREGTILTRERDVARVTEAIERILGARGAASVTEGEGPRIDADRVNPGVYRLTLTSFPLTVLEVLDRLDEMLQPGVATLDHVAFVCPHTCPATEPMEVPPGTADPLPPPGANDRCCCPGRSPWPPCDGAGVFISVVDTGLIRDADAGHPWLAGVGGATDPAYEQDAEGHEVIVPYAGHGTFVAGVARCMAPSAAAYVERAFNIAGADYESNLSPSLEDALDRHPDIMVFTFTAATRNDASLLIFDDFYERRIRYRKGMVVVAPAGNDGKPRPMWPAASREVISVGALAATGPSRAAFSNHGPWVDVYAPGEDLVNAFPRGDYVCNEPSPNPHRRFHGMARWSGTSFSTPLVAGLIAARMSATGENARQAADALLRLACGQAIPGVGAVLYPGQACCEPCRGRCG